MFSGEIEKEVALSFFRILEEALVRCQTYHASNVSVELIGSSRELLSGADNGVGFEFQKRRLQRVSGSSAGGRLRSIGGGLAVWSTPTAEPESKLEPAETPNVI